MPGLAPSTRLFLSTRNRGLTPILLRVLLSGFAGATVLMASNGQAEDLIQVYRDAQRYDAVYAAARQTLAAGRERLPQGRALLLPNLNLSANAQVGRIDSESRNTALTPSFTRDPRTLGYTLTLAQPIYRPQNYLQYRQSELQVAQAEEAPNDHNGRTGGSSDDQPTADGTAAERSSAASACPTCACRRVPSAVCSSPSTSPSVCARWTRSPRW